MNMANVPATARQQPRHALTPASAPAPTISRPLTLSISVARDTSVIIMSDNEKKALDLVAEAEKKLGSSKSFLGGLFG